MTNTSKLGVPLLAADQSQKHVTMNDATQRFDQLVQASVINATTTSPPGSPSEGHAYIIAATATGVWVGAENQIAAWVNGAWYYFTPRTGWLVFNEATNVHLKWNGSAWVNAFSASGDAFGWQDFQDTATAGSPIAMTAADTWYDVTNDGLGPLTDTTFGISGHGPIWDTAAQEFDFSDLAVGDMVRFRTDLEFTTNGANNEVSTRLAFGPSFAFDIPYDSKDLKSAGTARRIRYFSFTIKNTDTLNNPAKLQVSSDTTGDTVVVNGWQVETHRP